MSRDVKVSSALLKRYYMPLKKGKSKKVFNNNVNTLISENKPIKQALAIAYSVKRKKPMAKKQRTARIKALSK